jgi:hypothetical protein
MTPAVPRISVLVGAVLALAACGNPASPSASLEASATSEEASQPPNVLAVICAPAQKPFDPNDIDLTGAWAGDDGGIYYLRQVESVLWWNGMSGREGGPLDLGRDWNNVGRGVINGLQIDVEWSDVPRGEFLNNGSLILTIEDDGKGNIQIVKELDEEDNFGNNLWTPCSPVELQVANYVQTYGGQATQFGVILTLRNCDVLAELESDVTTTLDTEDAGSPEWRAALGYSNAINERQLALDC